MSMLPSPDSSSPIPPAVRRRVLVVEDHASSRRALERLLRMHDFDVCTAGTVAEAMDRLRMAPDFVILDLMLPDGDGTDILKHIREHRLPCQVTVLTGNCEPEHLARARRLGTEVLEKPIQFPAILQHLGRAA